MARGGWGRVALFNIMPRAERRWLKFASSRALLCLLIALTPACCPARFPHSQYQAARAQTRGCTARLANNRRECAEYPCAARLKCPPRMLMRLRTTRPPCRRAISHRFSLNSIFQRQRDKKKVSTCRGDPANYYRRRRGGGAKGNA